MNKFCQKIIFRLSILVYTERLVIHFSIIAASTDDTPMKIPVDSFRSFVGKEFNFV